MTALTSRTSEDLESIKGFSENREKIVQDLNDENCALTGFFKFKYEQELLNFARISDEYSGGVWEVEQGIWLLQDDVTFQVGNPNTMSIESLDSKSFSIFCSIAALNRLSWIFHEKGSNELMGLSIYAYHRAYTQLDIESDIKADVIRSLLD